eukprot:jgi/Galph1/5209/GphlegSOOS_G3841.1
MTENSNVQDKQLKKLTNAATISKEEVRQVEIPTNSSLVGNEPTLDESPAQPSSSAQENQSLAGENNAKQVVDTASNSGGTVNNNPTQNNPPIVNPMDHHANERTFNSWQRTSAAYITIGIALAKFFKGLTAIAGFIFFLVGCIIVVFAALRFEAKRSRIDKFEYPAETVGPWVVTLCTVGVGILSLIALWIGGNPITLKDGKLHF